MVNLNGIIHKNSSEILSSSNRSFCYGDGVFETIRIVNGIPKNLQRHYFRLMASMRMIRMDIPMNFTERFVAIEIKRLIDTSPSKNIQKMRLTVFRKQGGAYTPQNMGIDYLIEGFSKTTHPKTTYKIDIYKEHLIPQGMLSNIKSTNRLLNVLAGIYAEENKLDTCVLINENKRISETTQANFFMVKDGCKIVTPPITEGCIKGVMRELVIESLEKHPRFIIEEKKISPFELQKAKEIFLTNAVLGIQPVTHYKNKIFSTDIAINISNLLRKEGCL